jgi:hypothetical protein
MDIPVYFFTLKSQPNFGELKSLSRHQIATDANPTAEDLARSKERIKSELVRSPTPPPETMLQPQ